MSAMHSAQRRRSVPPTDSCGASNDPAGQAESWTDASSSSGDDLDLDLDDVDQADPLDGQPNLAAATARHANMPSQFTTPSPSPSPSHRAANSNYPYQPHNRALIKTAMTPLRKLNFNTTSTASSSTSAPAQVQASSSSSSCDSAASTASVTGSTGSITPRASVINPLAAAAAAAAAAASAAKPDPVFRVPGAPASAYSGQHQQQSRRPLPPPRTPIKEQPQPSSSSFYSSQPWSASPSYKIQLPPPVTPTRPSQCHSRSHFQSQSHSRSYNYNYTQSHTDTHTFTLPASTPTKPSTTHPPAPAAPASPFTFHSPPHHLRHRHRIQRRTRVPPRATPPPVIDTDATEHGSAKDRTSRWSGSTQAAAARKRARDTLARSVSRSRSRSARQPPFVATPVKGTLTPAAAAAAATPACTWPAAEHRSRTSNISSTSTCRSAASRWSGWRRRRSRVSADGLRVLVVPGTPHSALKRVSLPRRLATTLPRDMYAHALPLGLSVHGAAARRRSKVRVAGKVGRVSLTVGLGKRRRSKLKTKPYSMDPSIPRHNPIDALIKQTENKLSLLGIPTPPSPRTAARAHAPAPHQHVPNTGAYRRTARAAFTLDVHLRRALLPHLPASQPPTTTRVSAAAAPAVEPLMRSMSQPMPERSWAASSGSSSQDRPYARALPPGPVGRTSLQMRVPGSGSPHLMADYFQSLCTWTQPNIGSGGHGTIIVGHGNKLSYLDAVHADDGLEYWQTIDVDGVRQVTAVEAHPTGEPLVAVGSKESHVLWMDPVSEEVVGRVSVTGLVDDRNPTRLASGEGGRGHLCAAKWSPVDWALCAVGTHRGDVVVLDTRAPATSAGVGAMVMPGAHAANTCGLAWHATGKYLASGSFDQAVRLWDLRYLRTGSTSGGGRATATGPSYRPLAEPLDVLTLHAAATKALAWCPWDSNVLAIGGGATGMSVSVWDAVGSKQVKHRIATQSQVTHVHWSEIHHELVATLGMTNDWEYEPGFAVFASEQYEYADVGKVKHMDPPMTAPDPPEFARNRTRPVHVCYSPCGRVTFTVDTFGRMAYYRLFDDGWDAGHERKTIDTLEQSPWWGDAEAAVWPVVKEFHMPIGVPYRWWTLGVDKEEPYVPVWPDIEPGEGQGEDEGQWVEEHMSWEGGGVGQVAAAAVGHDDRIM